MAVVLCLVAALLFPAHPGLCSPLSGQRKCVDRGRECVRCPAGEYQSSCNECSECPSGTYKVGLNCESSCLPCYRDCRPALNKQVEAECSAVANVRCRCAAGFSCSVSDPTGSCYDECEPEPTSRGSTLGNPPAKSSTSSASCRHPNCHPQRLTVAVITPGANATQPTTRHAAAESRRDLAAIVSPIAAIGFLALILLFCIRRQGDEVCFKRVLKLCNERVKDGSPHKAASQQQTRDQGAAGSSQPDGLKLPPLAAANLGPVHVHSAGTVIFSLLNHFTGQGEGEKRGQTEREEEDVAGFQNHPIPSPQIHLSQQEGDGEMDYVFFPSQEQGKDCHMSKEEVL